MFVTEKGHISNLKFNVMLEKVPGRTLTGERTPEVPGEDTLNLLTFTL